MVVMELVNTVKITLPDALSEALDSLDDEQLEMQKPVVEELTIVPECLCSEEANELWEIAQEEGWVDENLQPKGLSRADAALMAARMAKVLGIDGWKPFESLWHRRNMRQDYSRSQYNQKTDDFEKKLKRKMQ